MTKRPTISWVFLINLASVLLFRPFGLLSAASATLIRRAHPSMSSAAHITSPQRSRERKGPRGGDKPPIFAVDPQLRLFEAQVTGGVLRKDVRCLSFYRFVPIANPDQVIRFLSKISSLTVIKAALPPRSGRTSSGASAQVGHAHRLRRHRLSCSCESLS